MKFKTLMKGIAGGACLSIAATMSFAETTMEKIVRTGQPVISIPSYGV